MGIPLAAPGFPEGSPVLGEWGLWDDQVDYFRRFGNNQSGCYGTTEASTRQSGSVAADR